MAQKVTTRKVMTRKIRNTLLVILAIVTSVVIGMVFGSYYTLTNVEVYSQGEARMVMFGQEFVHNNND